MPRVDVWPHGVAIALPLAVSWAVLRHERASVSLNEAQTFDLVFGVLMLAVGVHARNFPFQHATSVLQSASLPLPRALMWRRAVRHQRLVLSVHYAIGLFAVCTWGALQHSEILLAALDWTCMCCAAAVVEPWVSGAAARWGRRFPERHPIAELQRSIGGGWTRPEAVVHLYAGAGALALTAAVAMPLQLMMLASMTRAVPSPSWEPFTVALAPLALLPMMNWWGQRWYEGAAFESTPWLHEATRTLAGPPTPDRAPAWIRWIPDPARRMQMRQFCRTVSLPSLRLLGPTAWTAAALTGDNLGDPIVLAAVALYVSAGLSPALRVPPTQATERLPCATVPLSGPLGRLTRRALPWTWALCPVILPLATIVTYVLVT